MNAENELLEVSKKQEKARRSRNVAIGTICFFLVILFYVMTFVKFSPNLLSDWMNKASNEFSQEK